MTTLCVIPHRVIFYIRCCESFKIMENLNIETAKITWERTKEKHGSEIKYKNQIINHGDHISVSKEMWVNGELKRQDLTHIPLELIDKIKTLESA